MIDPDQCNQDVFKNGTVLGIFACTKEVANRLCERLTKETGYAYDWHYVAGRVVIKTLDPEPVLDQSA